MVRSVIPSISAGTRCFNLRARGTMNHADDEETTTKRGGGGGGGGGIMDETEARIQRNEKVRRTVAKRA